MVEDYWLKVSITFSINTTWARFSEPNGEAQCKVPE
jgi:hypothetical protein